MKNLTSLIICAFALLSASSTIIIPNDKIPTAVSENRIISDCPDVTCSAATIFQGMLSNTGQSSGGPYAVTGVMLYINFASGMSISDLNIGKGEVTMQTDEMIGVDIGMMDADEVIDFSFLVIPIQTGNFISMELVQNEFNPGTENDFMCNMEFVPCADLKLTKSTEKSVYQIQEHFSFDFKVENFGPDISENVVVYDDFFSPFEIINYPDFCQLNLDNNALTCMLGTMAPGESKSFSVETSVEFPYENTNLATVFSDTNDPITSNNSSSATVSIIESSIDLEVSITSDKDPIGAGQDINYTIKVKNNGEIAAQNVKLTNQLPSFHAVSGVKINHLEIVTPPPGCAVSTTEIVCEIPILESGEEKSFSYLAFASEMKDLTNHANAYAESPDEEFIANNETDHVVHVKGHYSSIAGNNKERSAADPVSVYSGEFYFSENEDLIQFGLIDLFFDRYYASRLHNAHYSVGSLGRNWSHNFDWRLIQDNTGAVEIHNYKGKVFVFENNQGVWTITNHPPKYQLASENNQFHFGDLENQSIYTFDENGRLIEITFLNGLGFKLSYEDNAIILVEDSFGRQLHFTYNENGNISSVTNGIQTSSYQYVNGLLTSCTLGNGKQIQYVYDELNETMGLITQRLDYDGQESLLTQVYGNAGEVLRQIDALGNDYTFVYDSFKTTLMFPDDRETIYEFDQIGSSNQITNPRGFSTKISYDDGNFRKSEDALGLPFDQFFNGQNGLTEKYVINDDEINIVYQEINVKGLKFHLIASLAYPDGSMRIYSYDDFGKLKKVITLGGDILEIQYDNNLLPINLLINDVPMYSYEYNEDGQLTKISDFEGSSFLFEYDGLGRRTKISTPEQQYQSFTYNSSHQPTVIIEGEDEINIEFTAFDEVSKVTLPDETNLSYLYDEMRRKIGLIDTEGDTIHYKLDYAGNILSISEREQTELDLEYDENFNIVSINRNDLNYTFEYDENDHLKGYTFPGGKKIDAELRPDGLVSKYTVDGNEAGTYQYDENNRLNGITYPSGKILKMERGSNGGVEKIILTDEISASFEAVGLDKFTKITDPNGGVWEIDYRSDLLTNKAKNPIGEELIYKYDHLNRLVEIKGASNATQIKYGVNNLPNMITYSDGENINLQYDKINRLTTSKGLEVSYDNKGYINNSNGLEIKRDKEGRITKVFYDDSFEVNYSYNGWGQLIGITDSRGNEYNFELYDNQLIKNIGRSNNTSTAFEYNVFNQVSQIAEQNSSANSETILTYDEDGKLIQVSKNGGFYPVVETIDKTKSFNPAHQLNEVNYDEAGNAQSSELNEMVWNEAGDLLKVSNDVAEVNFQFDLFGNRITKQLGSNNSYYTYNYALERVQIATIKKEVDKSYLVSDPEGRLLYQVDSINGETKHYHFDERDNTSFITDQDGKIIQQYAYSPYGQVTELTTEVENAFTFLGRWGVMWDKELGLLQMHKRFYDQESKRFLSRDQDFERMDPRLINPYVYSPQDPINFIDPNGNTPQETQENNLHVDGKGVIGTIFFVGGSVATGLPVGFEAPKLPNFKGGLIKGVIDLLAGSPGAPGSFSASGFALNKAKDAAHTARAAGIHGNTTIKNAQTNVAVKNARLGSNIKTLGKGLNATGNALTVANVGVALNNTRKKINEAEDRVVTNVNSSAQTFSIQLNNYLYLLKIGKIDIDEFNRAFKNMKATNDLSISASNIIFLTEITFEGTDGFLKSLEAMLPNPTNGSISNFIYGLFGQSAESLRQ